MSGFYKTWLKGWCWSVIAFGIAFAGAATPATDGFARLFYDLVYWPLDGASPYEANMAFTVGILGAVTLGWGLTALAFVDLADQVGVRAWRALGFSLAAWYVVDSTISVAARAPGNAVSNTFIIAMFLIPLAVSGALSAPNRNASHSAQPT